jgi:hypothetical protein
MIEEIQKLLERSLERLGTAGVAAGTRRSSKLGRPAGSWTRREEVREELSA